MFTLVGFNENAETAAVYNNIAGIADQVVHVEGDIVYVPEKFNKILMVCAVGLDCGKAKLESPSIRKMGVLDINPHGNYDLITMGHFPCARWTPQSPISLVTGEGLEGKTYVGTDITHFQAIGVLLGDAPATPVTGEIWTVRATCASTTPEESKWVNVEMTFDETLPVGRYQVVGCEVWMQSGLLFRLVPIGAMNRPGGLICCGNQQRAPDQQRWGYLGVWCEFHSSTPPSIDIVASNEVASTISVHLDLIKVA